MADHFNTKSFGELHMLDSDTEKERYMNMNQLYMKTIICGCTIWMLHEKLIVLNHILNQHLTS